MRNDETTVERNAKKEKDMSSEQNFKKSKVAKSSKKGSFSNCFQPNWYHVAPDSDSAWNLYYDSVLSECLYNLHIWSIPRSESFGTDPHHQFQGESSV